MGMRPRSVKKDRMKSGRGRRAAREVSMKEMLRWLRWSAGTLLVAVLPFAASCNLGELAVALTAIAGNLGDEAPLAMAEMDGVSGDAGDASVRSNVLGYLRRHTTGLSRLEEAMLADGILRSARESRTDYRLILAVIHVESRFSNWATSPKGALGLMQVMPSTGRLMARELSLPWAGTASLFDPITNVHIGTSYFAKLRAHFGDVGTALMAYNRGPAAEKVLGTDDPYADDYVSKVLGQYHRLMRGGTLVDSGARERAPSA